MPYVFEGPSFEIWDRVGRGLSEAALVAELSARYDVPLVRVAADVAPFVDQLIVQGLVGRCEWRSGT